MAVPFNEANITALSRALMSHAPEYVFTAEALDKLHLETALTIAQILKWADAVRHFMAAELREHWLHNDGKYPDGWKVSPSVSFS